MSRALVIGSGIAGMATAIRLRSQGWEVDVYEANSYPGGKLSAFDLQGYRFDAGPSLFTLPNLVEELIKSTGKEVSDYFEYETAQEACRYFWNDGTKLTAWSDREAFAKEVESELGEKSTKVVSYLKEAAVINTNTESLFLKSSLHRLKTYFDPKVLPALGKMHRFHLFSSLHRVNAQRFKNPKLVQLFDRFATYNGSDPYRTPGVMQVISHLEHNVGTFYPKGGMHSITGALYKLATDIGVSFHFKAAVQRIEVKKKKVRSVIADGKRVEADLFVSNADVYSTYRHLMPDQQAPERILNHERSSSALIFYWGVKKSFPQLGLHNIFFSDDYKKEFQKIFKDLDVAEDPTVYVNITSKYTPSDAPSDSENWFVMINVPGDFGQDWAELTQRIRKMVIKKLNSILDVNMNDLIEAEDILDPPGIERKTSSFRGSLYGSGSNDVLSAFLRHPNFSRRLNNLYFAGGSAHPGGGIPLCLLSAEITANLIKEDHPHA
jgi:phytoene desaturase